MALTIKLAKEVDGTSEVTLRDIETGDYIRLGPVMAPMIDAEGRRRMLEETKVLSAYITRISGLTESQLGKLALQDFMQMRDFVITQLAFGAGSEESTVSPSS